MLVGRTVFMLLLSFLPARSSSSAFVLVARRAATLRVHLKTRSTAARPKSSSRTYFRTATTRMSSDTDEASSPVGALTAQLDSLLLGKKLVSVDEARQAYNLIQSSAHTDDKNRKPGLLQFIDGSWFLKDRNARDEYEQGPRLPGAIFWDIDRLTDYHNSSKDLPHMMPSATFHAACMDALHITNDHHLIVYTPSRDCMFVHRAWMQFLCMGHDPQRLHLLQGDLEEWHGHKEGPLDYGFQAAFNGKMDEWKKEEEQRHSTTTEANGRRYQYQATEPRGVVRTLDDMKAIVARIDDNNKKTVVVDVRSTERFLGRVPEPRPNLRLGHMPGAINLPFFSLLNPDNVSQFKPKAELRVILQQAGLIQEENDDDDGDAKIIVATCGSGATACALACALFVCGRDPSKTYIYDGSWMDWASEPDTPIVKDEE